MIPNYKSRRAARWAPARRLGPGQRTSLDINYVVWRQQIWNIQRAGEGWRFMADRGDDSANHINHVHISVFA